MAEENVLAPVSCNEANGQQVRGGSFKEPGYTLDELNISLPAQRYSSDSTFDVPKVYA